MIDEIDRLVSMDKEGISTRDDLVDLLDTISLDIKDSLYGVRDILDIIGKLAKRDVKLYLYRILGALELHELELFLYGALEEALLEEECVSFA